MADFTDWSTLHTALKNALSNRDLAVASHRAPDGTQIEYRSFTELRELEGWAAQKAATDNATSGDSTRRTEAKFRSGGGW